jgi:hypothetical protein
VSWLKDVRIHDLRHTFASTAIASGQGLPMIGKLLGHTQVQTTARYAHLAADPIKNAADPVASNIAASLNQAPCSLSPAPLAALSTSSHVAASTRMDRENIHYIEMHEVSDEFAKSTIFPDGLGPLRLPDTGVDG